MRGRADQGRHAGLVDEAIVGGEREARQDIAKLADVAGPGTRGEFGDGLRCDLAIRIDCIEQMPDDGVEVGSDHASRGSVTSRVLRR